MTEHDGMCVVKQTEKQHECDRDADSTDDVRYAFRELSKCDAEDGDKHEDCTPRMNLC